MDKLIRREFTGNWIILILLCLSGIGLPIAIFYFIEQTIVIESTMDDVEEFLEFAKKNK